MTSLSHACEKKIVCIKFPLLHSFFAAFSGVFIFSTFFPSHFPTYTNSFKHTAPEEREKIFFQIHTVWARHTKNVTENREEKFPSWKIVLIFLSSSSKFFFVVVEWLPLLGFFFFSCNWHQSSLFSRTAKWLFINVKHNLKKKRKRIEIKNWKKKFKKKCKHERCLINTYQCDKNTKLFSVWLFKLTYTKTLWIHINRKKKKEEMRLKTENF